MNSEEPVIQLKVGNGNLKKKKKLSTSEPASLPLFLIKKKNQSPNCFLAMSFEEVS